MSRPRLKSYLKPKDLREFRKSRSMTKVRMAELLGLSMRGYTNYERCESPIPLSLQVTMSLIDSILVLGRQLAKSQAGIKTLSNANIPEVLLDDILRSNPRAAAFYKNLQNPSHGSLTKSR